MKKRKIAEVATVKLKTQLHKLQNDISLSVENFFNDAKICFCSLLRFNSARQSKSLREQFSSWRLLKYSSVPMWKSRDAGIAWLQMLLSEFYKGYCRLVIQGYSGIVQEHLVYLIRWCTRYIRKFFRKRHRQMRVAFFKTGRSVILLRDSTTNNARRESRLCIQTDAI